MKWKSRLVPSGTLSQRWSRCCAVFGRPASPGLGEGFTLIELLVVVAIIALLISIMLPALGRARDTARTSVCGSGLRQMGVAMSIYLHDNRETIFPWRENFADHTLYWFGYEALPAQAEGSRIVDRTRGRLWPYYERSDSIEICPSFPNWSSRYKKKFTTNWSTYGLPRGLSEPGYPVQLRQIIEPSRMLMFVDSAQINAFQFPATPSNPMFEQWFYVAPSERTVAYLHNHRANAVTFDGHVETVFPQFGYDPRFPEAPIGLPPANVKLQLP